MDPFYRRLDEDLFESLPPTAGPWSARAQHAGPPTALLARAMEVHEPREESRLADVRTDILGPIPVAPLQVSVRTVRGGRSMDLLEATGSVDGSPALVARAWRIQRAPGDFPHLVGHRAGDPPAVPEATDGGSGLRMPGAHEEGYLRAIEWRFVEGGPGTDGTAVAWGRQLTALVEGEEPGPWERALVLADSGGGISLGVDPRRQTYINCDLHVALDRDPEGEWVRLSSQSIATPGHGGIVHSVLADVRGDLGVGVQTMVAQHARTPS